MEEGRPKNWLKISCVGCIGLPISVVLLTFGALKCQVNQIGDQLPMELAALKKMGVPTEPADLTPNPPVPDSENAKFLLQEIIADQQVLKERKDYKACLSAFPELQGSPPESNPKIVEGISLISSTLQKLDGISKYQRVDFKRDASLGADLLFPETAPIKEMAKWQAARSRLLVKQGRFKESLVALHSIFITARLLASDPYMICALVGMSIDTIGHAALANHLEAIHENEAALTEAAAMLNSLPPTIDAKRSLSGEFVLGRVSTQKIRSLVTMYGGCYPDEDRNYNDSVYISEQNPMDRLTFGDPAVRRMFEAKFLQAWRKAYALMPESDSDWKGIMTAMDSVSDTIEDDVSLVNQLNRLLFPFYGEALKSMGLFQARHRLSLLAIRLLQDRQKGLPKDLTKYGELGIDPMNGKPIRYDRKGNGFKIWSVGKDDVDNHGTKYYPHTGMRNQNVDEVLLFSYPEKLLHSSSTQRAHHPTLPPTH